MKIVPNRRVLFSLETLAMTDIIMNMFIFFFISFSLLYTFNPTRAKQIKVNLPKAKNVALAQKGEEIVNVTLSSDGPIYVDAEMISIKDLKPRLEQRLQSNSSLGVILNIDRLVAFKNVVGVLDILNGLGIDRLRIAAEEENK